MPGLTVVSSFFDDVRKDSEAALAYHGVHLPPGTSARDAVVECFHLERRLIQPIRRRVVRSKQLQARALSDDEREAIDRIVQELERGVNLTPRMTKSIRKAGYNDGLLTDWGIHHLHLGGANDKRDPQFVERADPLLFVFVAGATAYLLALLDHKSFEDDDLIEIIHENWPEVIAPRRASGFVPGSLEPLLTPEQRKVMRRKFNMGTQTKDGTIYMPPGGGVMMNGHSFEAVRKAYALLNLVHPAEVWVRENAGWIAAQVERRTGVGPTELHLRFDTAATSALGNAVVTETRTNISLLGVPPPAWATEPDVAPFEIAGSRSRPAS
jgi:hypothetical protein